MPEHGDLHVGPYRGQSQYELIHLCYSGGLIITATTMGIKRYLRNKRLSLDIVPT